MRKLKLFFACLLMAVLSIGQMWGATADVTYDFTGSGWTVSSGTLSNGTVSFTGAGGANFKMNSGYFMMGKSGAYLNFPTYSKAVEKIVVTGNSGASTSAKQNIYVGDNAVSTETTGATGTNTYNIDANYQAAGTTYTLKVTSSHNTQITKIEIFYVSENPGENPGDNPGGNEPGGEDPTPSGDNLEMTFDVSSNPGEWPTTNSYTQTNYTYTLNEVDYTFDLHNVKCNSGYLMLTQPAQLGLPAIDGYKLVKIEAKNSSGCSTSTKVRVTSSATDNTQIVSGGNEQTWSTQGNTYTYTLSDTEANTMYYLWVANKNCQIIELKLYYDAVGDAPAVTVAKPTFSIAEGAYLEAKSVEIECTTEGASIYYTLDGNDPTSASTPYEGAISITETKTLKAIAIKGETSSSIASATYTIVSTEHAGTAEDPYSVADARIVIDAVGTTGITDKYVAGIISNVKSLDPSKYARAQYYISDNGERENEVYVYNGYYLNGADFTANDQIMVGDEVVVKGNLVKYNTTYEIDQNSQIVSLEREKQASGIAYDTKAYIVKKGTSFNAPVLENPNNLTVTYISNNANVEVNANTGEITLPTETAGVSVEITATFEGNATYNAGSAKYTVYVAENAGTAEDPLTVSDAKGLIDGISTMDNVFVKGIINEVSSFSDQYKSITYWISDNGETKDLQVYSGKGLNSANFTEQADLQVADEVVVCGTLKKYNSTYEFDKNNYLSSLVRKQDAELAWDPAEDIEITVGDAFSAPTLLNPNSIDANEITIASDNTDLATVTAGVVELVENATGTAKISATFAGNDQYKAASVSYTITVNAATPAPTNACEWDLTAASFDAESNVQVTWSCDQVSMVADKANASTATNNYLGGDHNTTRFYKSSTLTFTPEEGYQITGIVVNGESGRAAAFGVSDSWTNATASIDGLVSTITPVDGTEAVMITFGSNAGATAVSVSYAEAVVKIDPELEWSEDEFEINLGDEFNAPTLSYKDGFTGTITYASDNEELATVSNAGVIELVAEATGTAKITASFAGDETYKKASAICTITVNSTTPAPETTDNVVIIAEYGSKFYAMTNDLNSGALTAIEITKDGDNIVVPSEEAKTAIQWTKKTSDNTTFQDADGKYLAHSGTGTSLTLQDADTEEPEVWTLHADGYYYAVEGRTFFYYKDDIFKNYSVSNLPASKTDYSGAPEIRVIAAENIVVVAPTTHTLSYNANGGTLMEGKDAIAPTQVAENATVTVAANVYEKEGYVFAGWKHGDDVYNAGQTFDMPTEDVELVAQWTVISTDNVVILAKCQGQWYAVQGVAGASNHTVAAVPVVYEDNVIYLVESKRASITWERTAAGTLASFKNGENYLSGKTSDSNDLDLSEDECWWTYTDQSIYQTHASHSILYSSQVGLFKNYKTSNKSDGESGTYSALPIVVPAVFGDPSYTTVREELAPNAYYTMCLEKAVDAVQGGSVWKIVSKAQGSLDIILEEVTGTLDAGRPYIFYATSDIFKVVYAGSAVIEPVDDEANHGLVGSFSQVQIANVNTNYIIYNNELYYVNTDNVYVGAHRAYIDMTAVPDYSEPQQGNAPRRRVTMHTNAPQVATGVDALNASETPVKVMINGQIFILRGEKMYDATGCLVK